MPPAWRILGRTNPEGTRQGRLPRLTQFPNKAGAVGSRAREERDRPQVGRCEAKGDQAEADGGHGIEDAHPGDERLDCRAETAGESRANSQRPISLNA